MRAAGPNATAAARTHYDSKAQACTAGTSEAGASGHRNFLRVDGGGGFARSSSSGDEETRVNVTMQTPGN